VVPLPQSGRIHYTVEVEVEVPANVRGAWDAWALLETEARVAGADRALSAARTVDAFRRDVVDVRARVARARDGFIRHCALIRAGSVAEENQIRALRLWIAVASAELGRARERLLQGREPDSLAAERTLADEHLSAELWSALTDCAQAFFETGRALEGRSANDVSVLEGVEEALAQALASEIAYRKTARFALAEPLNALQLERLLSKMRQMRKHFERELVVEAERHEVLGRPAAWLAALATLALYAWFFFAEVARARGAAAISAIVAFVLVTAWAYAARERLREIGGSWLGGPARAIAQRTARYRVATSARQRGSAIVARAREGFALHGARRPSPREPGASRDVTVLRIVHRGSATRPAALESHAALEIRFAFRLDLAPVFPRLEPPPRGLAAPDARTGRVAIVDVPRSYELPIRATLRMNGRRERVEQVLLLNKQGLLRLTEKP
jgi:hypothetical protein